MLEGVSGLLLSLLAAWTLAWALVLGVGGWWFYQRVLSGVDAAQGDPMAMLGAGVIQGAPPLAALLQMGRAALQANSQPRHPGGGPQQRVQSAAGADADPDADASSSDSGNSDSESSLGAGEDCVICLQRLNWAVETNCGHRYCCGCFLDYFRRGRNLPPPEQQRELNWWQRFWTLPYDGMRLGPVVCALCRRKVNLIVPAFDRGRRRGGNYVARLNDIADYNNRFAGRRRGFLSALRDAPLLLQRFCRDFSAGRALFLLSHTRLLLVLLGSVLYALSPLDLIPEAVFGVFGLLDDALVILLSMLYVSIAYRGIVQNQLANMVQRLRRQE